MEKKKKREWDRRKGIYRFVCLFLLSGWLLVVRNAGIDEMGLAAAQEERSAGNITESIQNQSEMQMEIEIETAMEKAMDLSVTELYAKSAVLMDGDSGRVLYEKDGYTILPMASTTKIMTCILALENGSLNDMFTVSSHAASMPKVHLGVKSGERYRLEDLLYSLMLESHNDSAVVIAEGIAGSVEAFVDMMNQKARDIGAYDTFFVTPNGLDATAIYTNADGTTEERVHSTTAADLAKILRYCIVESPMKDKFLEITRTDSHFFSEGDGNRTFGCYNHNAFLDMMDGALTGKTGFTGSAGYCYVGAVERDGELYIVALLACGWPNNKTYKWSDMKKLVNFGLENYEYRDVWREVPLTEVPVVNGIPWDGSPDGEAYVPLTADCDGQQEELLLLLKEGEEVVQSVKIEDSLTAPVAAGTVAGTVTYTLSGETVKSYNLLTVRTVEERDFNWYLTYVFHHLWQMKYG